MLERKFGFDWSMIGDVELGRPSLGHDTSVEMYRLMQCAYKDILEKAVGTEKADGFIYQAGYLAGSVFFKHYIKPSDNFEAFVKQLESLLRQLKFGLIAFEKEDHALGEYIVTVSEDLDCSGLPNLNYEFCTYDEGFISAIFEGYTGEAYDVEEIDCWCTGDRTCRFRVTKKRVKEIYGTK